jgi:hypothetical protein
MPAPLPPLWQCPRCGERFVTRNMWHSCGTHTVEALFAGCEPQVMPLFERFAKMVRTCGPVAMIPQKTRLVFQVRVRFVGIYPRKSHFLCGLILGRKLDHPRFVKIETFSPRSFGHHLRLAAESDLDDELAGWLQEAYAYGEQQHLAAKQG